jgi:exodeoxyribonuclease V alpha subunit
MRVAEQLEGHIERITYQNPDTGYTVVKVKVPNMAGLVTAVGKFPNLQAGQTLLMQGQWKNHAKYGDQFDVESHQVEAPASIPGIQKYLASGLVKGIGPVMAERMVKQFGTDTLRIIEHQPDRLLEVEGLGPKRLGTIQEAWQEQKEIRRVILFLQDHGVSSSLAVKIFKQYGEKAVELVSDNPYRLAEDIFGVGFLTADSIASQLGFAPDSPRRAQAGLLYVLRQTAAEGHVYYPYESLLDRAQEVLKLDRDNLTPALARLVEESKVVITDLNREADAFQENNKAVYSAELYSAETGSANRIRSLLAAKSSLKPINADKALAWVMKQLDLRLAGAQADAVRQAVAEKLLVITGGPGTGKTTIIKAILTIMSRAGAGILLAAPTGRAAKRMTEATGWESRTIHRLLEFNPQTNGFKKNQAFPLDCDLIVLDETSMLDIVLFYHLLAAVPDSAVLIMVGDVDQLPSVGPGNVLRDLIQSGAAPIVRLTEIFRQARESTIIVNAHRINKGEKPFLAPRQKNLEDFYFIDKPHPEDAWPVIVELVADRLPKRFGFNPFEDIQVLTPMHRGLVGTGHLNARLQEALNPGKSGFERGGVRFSQGDKVMQVKNNYDKDVFNGDLGRMTSLDLENGQAGVIFDKHEIPYSQADLDELILAYAVSVHKSQGSEYPAVIIPLVTQHYVLLQRNLLYTAVTRGQSLVVLVGAPKALELAVGNDRTRKRFTGLTDFLT